MDKYTAGFGLSLVVASFLNAIILIVKEKNTAVMSALKAALGHHWITHGLIVIAVFIILGFIFSNMKLESKLNACKIQKYIIWSVIISGVIIAGFFLPNLKVS
ncbi:MAG TPA: hypothetical protein PLR24_10965 [Saprospiraceae bacterium]|nr:hypothetical protein [Saprospiraceae bacterium]